MQQIKGPGGLFLGPIVIPHVQVGLGPENMGVDRDVGPEIPVVTGLYRLLERIDLREQPVIHLEGIIGLAQEVEVPGPQPDTPAPLVLQEGDEFLETIGLGQLAQVDVFIQRIGPARALRIRRRIPGIPGGHTARSDQQQSQEPTHRYFLFPDHRMLLSPQDGPYITPPSAFGRNFSALIFLLTVAIKSSM